MNEYIERNLTVPLATVIHRLAWDLIDMTDLMQVVTDPPENEEDLLDFIVDDDIEKLIFVVKVVKDLIKGLQPSYVKALNNQLIALDDAHPKNNECADCGGTLLISCTCEG